MEDADAAYQASDATNLDWHMTAGVGEATRGELARDLHDTVIQPLTSLVVSFTCFERQAPLSADHVTAYVTLWKGLAQEALDSLRATLAGLPPYVDGGRNLPEVLHRSLALQLSSRGLRLIIDSYDWPSDLPLNWNRHLYLATREAITNVEKHAAASVVNVRLHAQTGGLSITVADNGVGLRLDDLAAGPVPPPGHGLGLDGIRDRLSLLGGRLRVAEAPGGGTILEMWLPRPQQATVDTTCASTVSGHWGVD
jgi:signal transduction histidine kinase